MQVPNILRSHQESEDYSQMATWGLLGVTAFAIIASIFLSPLKVLGLMVGVLTVYVGFWRPIWLLGFLLTYLPFESFILKFVPDDIYVFARYYSELIVYLLCAVVLWRLITHRIDWRFTVVDLPFAFLLVAMLVSAILNLNPVFISLLGIRQIIRFILLYFIVMQLRPSAQWIKTVLFVLAGVAVVQMGLGYGQAIIGAPLDELLLPGERKTVGAIELTQGTDYFWDPGQRVFGTLGRYDRLGTFLFPLFTIAVAWLYGVKKRKDLRAYAGYFLVVGLPVLALTYSRASWFAFVIGALFISYIVHKDRRLIYGLGIGALALLVYVAISGLVVSQLVDVASQPIVVRLLEAFSLERWYGEYYGLGRLYWIVQTLTVVLPASFVIGFGPGTYGGGTVTAMQYTETYDQLGLPFGVFGTQGMIDNNLMSLLGELGLLGWSAYAWLYLAIFFLLWRGYEHIKDELLKAIVVGIMAIMPGMVLVAFLGTYLEVRTVGAFLWVYLGIATLITLRAQPQSSNKSSKS